MTTSYITVPFVPVPIPIQVPATQAPSTNPPPYYQQPQYQQPQYQQPQYQQQPQFPYLALVIRCEAARAAHAVKKQRHSCDPAHLRSRGSTIQE